MFADKLIKELQRATLYTMDIFCVVGVHNGIGAISITFCISD